MERYGSATAIEQTYLTRTGARATIQEIVELWRAEDRLAVAVMEESFTYSCIGIINMLQILRPECLILGGGLMEIDSAVFTCMARRLDEHMPEAARGTVAVLTAVHGNRAGMIGAGIQALAATQRDTATDGRASAKQTRNTGGLQ
jgi:predicted NBD/HSP70 family sugar kinase